MIYLSVWFIYSEEVVIAEVQPLARESAPTGEGPHALTKLATKVKPKQKEEVKIDLKANLGGINVVVASVEGNLAEILIGGMSWNIPVVDICVKVDCTVL